MQLATAVMRGTLVRETLTESAALRLKPLYSWDSSGEGILCGVYVLITKL